MPCLQQGPGYVSVNLFVFSLKGAKHARQIRQIEQGFPSLAGFFKVTQLLDQGARELASKCNSPRQPAFAFLILANAFASQHLQ